MKVDLLCVVSSSTLPGEPFELSLRGEVTFCFVRPDVARYALYALEIRHVVIAASVEVPKDLRRILAARMRVQGGQWLEGGA